MKYSANPCVKKEVQIDDHVRPSCHSIAICDSYEILKKEGETTEDPVCRNHLATSKKQITAYLSHLCLRKKSCHAFLRDYFKLKEKKITVVPKQLREVYLSKRRHKSHDILRERCQTPGSRP